MNEAVDRVIEQREGLDRGFPASLVLSVGFHLLVAGAAFGAAWLAPRKPLVRITTGVAIPLPPGGGGPVAPAPLPAAAKATPAPEPAAPPPPKVIKPPKEEPKPQGLPRPDARKRRPPPEKSAPPPSRAAAPAAEQRRPAPASTQTATPGLGLIGPAGPGAPGGTDPMGDWYLAGVQRKIWVIWVRQVKAGFSQPIRVAFTILGDGSLEEGSVQVVQPSGVQLLDLAAQRAVYSAQPFAPLPRTYGTNRITIQALFQPTP